MPSSTAARDVRFLDPAVIARLGSMELKARTVVEGFLSGLHRSPYKGFSVEFAEYRQYLPGDDLAAVDWNVYARTDRHSTAANAHASRRARTHAATGDGAGTRAIERPAARRRRGARQTAGSARVR